MTKQYILKVTQRKRVSEILLSKQLRVLEHWLGRLPKTTTEKLALYNANQERDRRGQPCITYVKLIQKVTRMDSRTSIQKP